MKEETKKTISLILNVIVSYGIGYFVGLLGGLSLLLGTRDFGQRPTSTLISLFAIVILVVVNRQNFKRKSKLRYGMLMGTIFTGVLTPLFGQFYSETPFMFGYSFMQVALAAIYQVLAWISYWCHIKIFDIGISSTKLKRWMFLAIFVIISSNLSGLIKILIGSITNTIYGAV